MLLASRYGTISSTGAAVPCVVVAGDLGAAVSSDGVNWTYTAFGTSLSNPRQSIFRPGNIVICGLSSPNEVRYSSDEGLTYSNVSISPNSLQTGFTQHAGFESGGTYAIGSGYVSGIGFAIVCYSTSPGSSWNQETVFTSFGNYIIQTLFYDGSQWIAGSAEPTPYALNKAATLGTGSWTSTTTPFNELRSIAYDGTTYVLATASSTIYTSTNLTSFTSRSAGATVDLVATNGTGRWLGVDQAGTTVRISTNNGVTWTAGTSPGSIRNMRYSSTLGKFIVSSTLGNVYVSTDGLTWTTSNIGVSMTLDVLGTI